jgi:hypothetical protein
MPFYRTYIQQLHYDGTTIIRGSVVDIYETYHIAVETFPFKIMPEVKPIATRDWPDEDGVDAYYGRKRQMKDYDMDVVFLYKGTHKTMKSDLQSFIYFLNGRNADAIGYMLAIYDEHVQLGRKNIRVEKISNDLYLDDDSDSETLAKFSVTFHVDDPVTDVYPQYSGIGVIEKLNW